MYIAASECGPMAKNALGRIIMPHNHRFLSQARLVGLAVWMLILIAGSGALSSWAQAPQVQGGPGQYPPGQYPPNRPQPIATQCQSTLADQISADARRRVSISFDTQSPYPAGNGRQGLRGRLRYGIGAPNSWRTATLRLRREPAPESGGTRDLHSSGQQQRLARRWSRWTRLSRRTRLSGGPGLSRRSGSWELPQSAGRHVGARELQQQLRLERQDHPWIRGYQHGASFGFTARQQLHDYVLRSGRPHRRQPAIQHANYRFRTGETRRDAPTSGSMATATRLK